MSQDIDSKSVSIKLVGVIPIPSITPSSSFVNRAGKTRDESHHVRGRSSTGMRCPIPIVPTQRIPASRNSVVSPG